MRRNRKGSSRWMAAKGLVIAVLATFALMVALTLVVWKADISDSALTLCNQLMKIGTIALGTAMAVGRGGDSGFLTGALIGTLYAALGYGCYALLGGEIQLSGALGEWLVGAAAGAFTGAVVANLPARKHRQTS